MDPITCAGTIDPLRDGTTPAALRLRQRQLWLQPALATTHNEIGGNRTISAAWSEWCLPARKWWWLPKILGAFTGKGDCRRWQGLIVGHRRWWGLPIKYCWVADVELVSQKSASKLQWSWWNLLLLTPAKISGRFPASAVYEGVVARLGLGEEGVNFTLVVSTGSGMAGGDRKRRWKMVCRTCKK